MTTDAPREDAARHQREGRRHDRWTALVLFLLTVGSIYWVGQDFWGSGWGLAIPLMAILVSHETGHYLAARAHGESPSPPFFLPLPWGNPFGTLGAVLLLDDRIRTRNALLDIGAAGPLAGLLVAIPVMIYGLTLSPVTPLALENYTQEGQSLLYWALKRVVLGPIPTGQDVVMHPIVGAAWAGLYVTFLNLIPFGQLDGGHVAYALSGERQNRRARAVVYLPAVLLLYNLAVFGGPLLLSTSGAAPWSRWMTPISAAAPWFALQILLSLMARWVGSGHPPTTDAPLSVGRRIIGWTTMSFFVLLFAPSPWVIH